MQLSTWTYALVAATCTLLITTTSTIDATPLPTPHPGLGRRLLGKIKGVRGKNKVKGTATIDLAKRYNNNDAACAYEWLKTYYPQCAKGKKGAALRAKAGQVCSIIRSGYSVANNKLYQEKKSAKCTQQMGPAPSDTDGIGLTGGKKGKRNSGAGGFGGERNDASGEQAMDGGMGEMPMEEGMNAGDGQGMDTGAGGEEAVPPE